MKTIMKGASILTAILMISMVFTPVFAAPVLPHDRYGTAYDSAVPIDTGLITAWIDGVEYGRNYTNTLGEYTLETQGDDTDSTNIKFGGYNGDIIRYVYDSDLTGDTAQFFVETDLWSVGGQSAHDLNTTGTIDLLKINNVSANNDAYTVTDYIVIYNPAGGAASVDITAYSIAVGTAAPIAIVAGDIISGMYMWNTNPIPDSDYLALDMGTRLGAANSIQLYLGANIVDRVEYGAIGAEPEDTILTNAADPGLDEIHRTAPGTDTNDCAADFAAPSAEFLPMQVLTTIAVTSLPTPVTYVTGDVATFAMEAQGLDQIGGAMWCAPAWEDSEGSATYSVVTPGNPATATHNPGAAPQVGSWTIYANDTGISGSAVLTITQGTLTTIMVTSVPTPVTYATGDVSTFAMTAQGYNENSVPMACAPLWEDSEGSATYSAVTPGNPATATHNPGAAPLVGTWTIYANDTGVSGSAVLTITQGTLTTITVTSVPTPVTYVTGDVSTFAMTAQGYNENSVPMACAPLWEDSEGSATYSAVTPGNPATATHNPGAAPQVGTWTIYANDTGVSGSAVLTITQGTPTTIVLLGVPTTVGTGGNSALTATVENEFGVPMAGLTVNVVIQIDNSGAGVAPDPMTDNGDGTYSATYTAGGTGGVTDTVRATESGTSIFSDETIDVTSAVTATATGPIGSGVAGITITYTTTGTPATVELFYSENGGAFVSAGIDATPLDGYAFVCPGVAGDTYDWIANVPGGDDDGVGIPGGPAEAGTYIIAGGVVYGPAAPTTVRVLVVGAQDTATDIEITWTDEAAATSYNIYRGTSADAINFGVAIANVAQGIGTYTDSGAIAGSAEYYYCVRSVDGGGVEGASSATVGKYTLTYTAGWNAFGCSLEVFPDTIDAWGYYMSDWWLINAASGKAIPSASSLSTFNQTEQKWEIRTPATPGFVDAFEIKSIEDGAMVFMDAVNDYTWTGWPAEQIRMHDFTGKAALAAPGTFRMGISGNDIVLTWDIVAGAASYEVFTSTSRNLESFNFAAPAYSGGLLTWTDTGAANTVGEIYYIVAASDGTDLGDSAYALGKHTRNFAAGWNAFTTPFEVQKYDAVDAWGYQLSDWKLINAASPIAIPSASSLSTFNQTEQKWEIRTPATPGFVDAFAIDGMGDCAMTYQDAAALYCWRV